MAALLKTRLKKLDGDVFAKRNIKNVEIYKNSPDIKTCFVTSDL